MKRLGLFIIVLFLSTTIKSQCFEIQSILVDACAGSQEGQNEMVIFQVGNTALNTSNLSVNWPNNNWLGLTKNASTASNVATVNATILGCGFLKEPTSGVLPANSKVLLVTSTAWSPLAQSFVNLTDTLYVIFQTAGNTAGHFANYQSAGGLRTLSMSFSSPSSCSDVVTYDRSLLINQSGVVGAQDGGTVEFTPSGSPSYVNNGCQAPFIPLSVNAGNNTTVCVGASQTYTAVASGAYTNVNWSLGSGATGIFSPSNSLTTTYTPGVGESGTVKLYCTITKSCGTQTTSSKDSVLLTFIQAPIATINPSVVSLCSGQSATLQANSNASSTYMWSNGVTSSSITVNTPGIYTVTVSNACGNTSQTASVTAASSTSVSVTSSNTLICSAQTTTLNANGGIGTYVWSTGATTSVITVSNGGVYTVTLSNSCGQSSSSVSITVIPNPTVSITSQNNTPCLDSLTILVANSNANNYNWSNGTISTNSISVLTSGVYSVSVSNSCGIGTASIQVTNAIPVIANISASPTSGYAPLNVSFINNSVNATSYIWNYGNGINANTQTVSNQIYNNSGNYEVILTASNGVCTDSDTLLIKVFDEESTFYIPNAFTPNGDGINDFFYVKAINIKEFNMIIFDRWGLKLFETNDITNRWDGKVHGQLISDGTYYYLIKAKKINDDEFEKQGHVTLFK